MFKFFLFFYFCMRLCAVEHVALWTVRRRCHHRCRNLKEKATFCHLHVHDRSISQVRKDQTYSYAICAFTLHIEGHVEKRVRTRRSRAAAFPLMSRSRQRRCHHRLGTWRCNTCRGRNTWRSVIYTNRQAGMCLMFRCSDFKFSFLFDPRLTGSTTTSGFQACVGHALENCWEIQCSECSQICSVTPNCLCVLWIGLQKD